MRNRVQIEAVKRKKKIDCTHPGIAQEEINGREWQRKKCPHIIRTHSQHRNMVSMDMGFPGKLPLEMWDNICLLLETNDLMTLTMVSKTFRYIAHQGTSHLAIYTADETNGRRFADFQSLVQGMPKLGHVSLRTCHRNGLEDQLLVAVEEVLSKRTVKSFTIEIGPFTGHPIPTDTLYPGEFRPLYEVLEAMARMDEGVKSIKICKRGPDNYIRWHDWVRRFSELAPTFWARLTSVEFVDVDMTVAPNYCRPFRIPRGAFGHLAHLERIQILTSEGIGVQRAREREEELAKGGFRGEIRYEEHRV